MTAKKCAKKRDARAQLLFCLFNPLPFLWSRSRCGRGILTSLSTHAIRNLSSTTERLIFPTLFLPYFPGWWMLPKARGLRFPAFPDELSWSLVPLKYHYPSLLTLTNFLVEYFQYYCSVDLPMFSWFFFLVQSIQFNFQDVLVLAKKPFGWKIPHSSDVIFPRTNLFPKEKGYSHCKVSSTMEKCDLRLPRWQFLDLLETTIYIVEPWKKRMGYVLFTSAFMHRGVINVNFTFSSVMICRTTVCWDPGILLPWQRDVTTSPPYWLVSEHKFDKMPYQLQNKLKRTKKRDCLSRKSSVKSALPALFNCRHDRNCVTIRTNSAHTRIAKTSIAPEKILLAAGTNRGSPCELKSE